MQIIDSLLVKSSSTSTGGTNELDTFFDFQSKGKRLEQIEVRHSDVIDGMRFMYGGKWTKWCGNDENGESRVVKLDEDEHVANMSGAYGERDGAVHILTLTIHTSKSRNFTFGTGEHGTGETDFNLVGGSENCYILGVSVKENQHTDGPSYVSELGVYYVHRDMEFIGSLCAIYKNNLDRFKGIVLDTYRDGRMNALVNDIKNACATSSDVIGKSEEWYRKNPKAKEEDAYIQVLAMLTFYNDYYKDKPITESITSFGLVAVGRRMWQYKTPIAGDYLFPNLRFMPLSDKEFNAYNETLRKVVDSPIYSIVSDSKKTFRVGSSSMKDTVPVFEGTKKLQNGNYGICSRRISQTPYTGTITTDNVRTEIANALEWVISNQIEIWILPEMCMDEDMLSYLRELLQKNNEQLRNLKLIVAGSTYRKICTDKYSNQAPIWILDKKQGLVELAGYDKKVPFSMNVPSKTFSPDMETIVNNAKAAGCNILVEDLGMGDDGVSFRIVRIESGYIGVAICRDVLDLSERCNPLNRYIDFVDVMLVVSMNSGHTNCFTSTAESMARWHYCATVYNNNMTSVNNPKDMIVEMTFAIWPRSASAAGIQGCIYYRKAPVFEQLLQNNGLKLGSDVLARLCSSTLTSIYSKGVVAKDMPEGSGNVYYDINVD